MDALVEAALKKVTETVDIATKDYTSIKVRKDRISKAINAVDALKSALKAL